TLSRRPTRDVEAFELYLKGRYFYNEGGFAPVQQALAYFQQALAHDSNHALAYAGIADAYQSLTASTYLGPREGMPKARAAVLKALALEPGVAQAHIVLPLSLAGKRRYAEALAEARKMPALAGDAPNFVGILGYVAGRAGERAEAQQILTALERRPPGNRAFAIALVHLGLGNNEQALRWLQAAYEERAEWLVIMAPAPFLDPLRPAPRFSALMRKVGIE